MFIYKPIDHIESKGDKLMRKRFYFVTLVLFVTLVFAIGIAWEVEARPSAGNNCFDAGCHNSDMSLQKPVIPTKTAGTKKAGEPIVQTMTQQPVSQEIALKSVQINGRNIEALIINNVMLVPVREIGDLLNAQVTWNGDSSSVSIFLGTETVVVTMGKNTGMVNGKEVQLAVNPQMHQGKAMVPIRFIGEGLGFQIIYSEQETILKKSSGGLGLNKAKALVGYVGAKGCKNCHPAAYKDWITSDHATMLQTADPMGFIVADFATNEYFQFDDVLYMVGQGKRFVGEKDDKLQYLPATWNPEKGLWIKGNWSEYTSCAECHTAGFNKETGNWAENGIACESCHGPGAEHAKAPSKSNIKVALGNEMCADCHGGDRQHGQMVAQMDNRSGAGHLNIFASAAASNADRYWDSTCFRCHSATYLVAESKGQSLPTKDDFLTGNLKEDRVGITCVVCHDPHKKTDNPYQLRKDVSETCKQCHQSSSPITVPGPGGKHTQKETIEGLFFRVDGSKDLVVNPKTDISCVDCHMGEGNHLWTMGNPIVEIIKKGQPYQIDPCASCHSGMTKERIEAFQEKLQKEYDALSAELDIVKKLYDVATPEKQAKAKIFVDVANTNLAIFTGDGSKGMHNTKLFQTSFIEVQKALEQAKKILK